MKNNSVFYLIFLSLIILTSCKYQPKNSNSIISSDSLCTKKIFFPHSLVKLNDRQFQEIDSFIYETEGKKKIISIIDGSCMKCIVNQLNMIDSVFNEIQADDEFVFIIILNVIKEDSVYFMRYLQPAIITSGVILWDNNYEFEQQNNLLSADWNLRTFMTNTENEIIQYGNPIINPNVIFDYQKKLNEKSNKE